MVDLYATLRGVTLSPRDAVVAVRPLALNTREAVGKDKCESPAGPSTLNRVWAAESWSCWGAGKALPDAEKLQAIIKLCGIDHSAAKAEALEQQHAQQQQDDEAIPLPPEVQTVAAGSWYSQHSSLFHSWVTTLIKHVCSWNSGRRAAAAR